MEFPILILSKDYTNETLKGMGALKGSPCTVKSVTPTDDGNIVTFAWTDTDGLEHTQSMYVKNGEKVNIEDETEELIIFDDSITSETSGWTSKQITEYFSSLKGCLTLEQITLLEDVLYSVAFTDSTGKSKVDSLINSLRAGASNDSGNTNPPQENDSNTPIEEPVTPPEESNDPDPVEPTQTNEKILTFEFTEGKNLNPNTGLYDYDGYYATTVGVNVEGYDYVTVTFKEGQSGYSTPNVIFSDAASTENWSSGHKVSPDNAVNDELGRWKIDHNYVYLATSKPTATNLDKVIWKAIKEG